MSPQLIISTPWHSSVIVPAQAFPTTLHLKAALRHLTGIPVEEQRLTKSGRDVTEATLSQLHQDLGTAVFLDLGLRLCGGKGGFRQQLRAMGHAMNARKPKNGNIGACRDLLGNKLRENERRELLHQSVLAELQRGEGDKKSALLEIKFQKQEEGEGPNKKDQDGLDDAPLFGESTVATGLKEALKQQTSMNQRSQAHQTVCVLGSRWEQPLDEDSSSGDSEDEDEKAPAIQGSSGGEGEKKL